MGPFNAFFHVGIDILKSSVNAATKVVLMQLGDAVRQITESDDAESWQHVGFVSRPSAPTAGKNAAQALALRMSDRDRVFATRDARGMALAGSLEDGESCLYAGGADGEAQGRVLLKANGAVTLYTTDDNTDTGQSVLAYVGPDKIQLQNKWGAIIIDSAGIQLRTANGAILKLGCLADAPVLLPGNIPNIAIPAQCTIVTGTCAVQSDTCFLGKLATPATPAHYGPAPIVSIPSVTVFCSP